MKKKFMYIAAIVICLSIISSGTLAFFTAEDTATNVITSGDVEIKVLEQQLVDGVLSSYPQQSINIMPGTSVSKIVTVQSMAQPAWLRIKCVFTVYNAEGEEMDVDQSELGKMILFEADQSYWTLKDGWWYYSKPISAGETSKPFFEEIEFSGPDIGNDYQGSTLKIDVKAQAVQIAHNGTTALEALGWPED